MNKAPIINDYYLTQCTAQRDADHEYYQKEAEKLKARIEELEKELQGYQAWSNSVNEALNRGDGSYHP